MKRMWQNWLAIVTLMTLAGSTQAQSGWNQPSEIGSYQSIMSRAGYGNGMGVLNQGLQPGVPMQGSAINGGGMVQNGGMVPNGAMAYGGGSMQGGAAMQSAPMTAAPTSTGPIVSGGTMSGGAMSGSSVMGSSVMGGSMMGGSAANGGVAYGSPMGEAVAAPVTSGQIMSLPSTPAPMVGGTSAMSATSGYGFAGGTVVDGGTCSPGGNCGSAPVFASAPIYSAAPMVYQPAVAPVIAAGNQRVRSNYTVGLTGLFFQRDYEDNRFLGSNPSGDTLFTNDADEQTFDGYGVNLGSRNCNGSGFEVGYWALNPGRAVATLTGANVATNIQGFDQLLHVPSGRDLYDIYSNTVVQTVVRDTDINNLEFNLLRNGGNFCTRKNRRGFYELLGGFRWFEFDESLQYTASIDTGVYPVTPSDFFYNLSARNRLLGFQLGSRNELCISPKLRLFSGVKGGIFNNNIRTVHNLTDINGEIAQVNAGPAAGRPMSYNDEKNDVAFLGELDFGVLYQLSCRSRLRFGYRVLGVSGVALAADQMAYNYADPGELSRANSNGSLLLGGGYYGIEFCF